MKAVFIIYGLALTEPVEQLLNKLSIRGFTRWGQVQGRGGTSGEPHYGTHAWPTENGAILSIMDEQQAATLLEELRSLNAKAEQQGLNAFVWHIEGAL